MAEQADPALIAEANTIALREFFRRPDQRLPARAVEALDQRRLDLRLGLAADAAAAEAGPRSPWCRSRPAGRRARAKRQIGDDAILHQVGRSCCGCLSRRNVGAGHVAPAASSGERHDHASPGGMWRGYAHGQRRLHYYIRTPPCSARSGHRSLKNLSSPIVRGHRRAAKFSGLARRRDADRHASLIPARLFARNFGERLPSPTPVTRI